MIQAHDWPRKPLAKKNKEIITFYRYIYPCDGWIKEKKYLKISSEKKTSIVTMEELPTLCFGC